MGGDGSKEKIYSKQDTTFFRKQMINSHKTFSINKQYEIIEKIGNGTYATVYKGRSRRNKKLCAIKQVDKSKAKGISQLLQNEFHILRELDHPNIIKIYGMYQDAKDYFIISQLIKGKELFEYIKEKKKLPQRQTFHIFYQVFLALNHLHKNKIMHRDVKLQNIIYDPQSKLLKLIDFGSAYQYQTKERSQYNCVGTANYIAPEVISKVYNYACDNWSLGVFLYLLLSGSPPFAGKDQDQTMLKIEKEPLSFSKPEWGTVSIDAKQLLQKLIQKKPQKRIDLDEVKKTKWFTTQHNLQSVTYEDQSQMIIILQRLSNFGKLKLAQMQLGVLVFMVNFVVAIQNEEQMIRCFHLIDFQGDGVITIDELVQSMIEFTDRPWKVAEAEAQQIMNKIDFNLSKDISYSQYLVAAADLEKVISDENLERTFNMIDIDNSGKLSAQELKNTLGQAISTSYYTKLISFFDEDKDGEISTAEFKKMMKKLLNK